MASISLKKIVKQYGQQAATIPGLDLEIRDGEFMVLVGPSGCGKSTTLRMIAGLESVSDGELRIGERLVNDVAAGERNIAMVFQSYALYPHMTVFENMAFGLRVRKTPDAKVREQVEATARALGLEPLLQRKPGELSGGQRQRVALGRALVRNPDVFLFDEPLSNLDAELRTQMRAEIARLHRTQGTTSVYVTHDQVEAMTLGDRIAIMNGGRLMQVGTPAELYSAPDNTFVAQFMGSPPMNIFSGQRDGTRLRTAFFEIELPTATAAALPTELQVGLRPECLSTTGTAATLNGRVEMIECLGHEGLAYLAAGDTQLRAKLAMEQLPQTGTDAVLRFNPADLYFFDTNGERIAATSVEPAGTALETAGA
ncbi:ABC transporter ATP-binding protein [Biformimicrobium ophioploci]|uniref:Sn-glycerol-3-phosphate ABC transporter ATP-binding protein UgpC n=1 Tax=Biformimicrobium ophioploci TaxID=3036711 RepID=A0ABQ6M122_9GAMM|nr:sn-glycerol-3-phosphate ABC transporter ATP-binding protein UgpC [Microbulbifer sp. NKW57]GMG88060.1 sn-glycerol-3-phosphate ABC transporter ATP-binding protein UgpC [Microbulbifer sp. NKW57]